jgi:hypothetical protein
MLVVSDNTPQAGNQLNSLTYICKTTRNYDYTGTEPNSDANQTILSEWYMPYKAVTQADRWVVPIS